MGVYDIMCFMRPAYGRTSILDAYVKEMRADLRAAPVEWRSDVRFLAEYYGADGKRLSTAVGAQT